MKKKINAGFGILAVLLLFSGAISLVELKQIDKDTGKNIDKAKISLDNSLAMLHSLSIQNGLMVVTMAEQSTVYRSAINKAQGDLEAAYEQAIAIDDGISLEGVATAKENYEWYVNLFLEDMAYTDMEWYADIYSNVYRSVFNAISEYIHATQEFYLSDVDDPEDSAYRGIAPGMITLFVAVIIILIFAYMVNKYFTGPVVAINKGLEEHLRHNVPFRVSTEGKDEISELRKNIEKLMDPNKN